MPRKKPSPKPKPSAAQMAEAERLRALIQAFPERPKSEVSMSDGGLLNVAIAPDHPNELYWAGSFAAVGSSSQDFLNFVMNDVVRACGGEMTSEAYNAVHAIMLAVQPTNELEALLAAQMISSHLCAMRTARGTISAGTIPQMQMYGGLANKFMRTFAAQMEALAKTRRGGEQVVRHVHVYEGGQAVVAGTIHQHRGEGVISKDGGQSDGTNAIAGSAALPRPDAPGISLPISGDAERALQDARRPEPRRAKG